MLCKKIHIMSLWSRLPIDIIMYITSFTYQPQSPMLCEDIKNFKQKYLFFIDLMENCNSDIFFQRRLLNNLYCYLNEGQPCMYGFRESILNTFKRIYACNRRKDVDKVLCKFSVMDVKYQTRVWLGILTPNERNEFVYKFVH